MQGKKKSSHVSVFKQESGSSIFQRVLLYFYLYSVRLWPVITKKSSAPSFESSKNLFPGYRKESQKKKKGRETRFDATSRFCHEHLRFLANQSKKTTIIAVSTFVHAILASTAIKLRAPVDFISLETRSLFFPSVRGFPRGRHRRDTSARMKIFPRAMRIFH